MKPEMQINNLLQQSNGKIDSHFKVDKEHTNQDEIAQLNEEIARRNIISESIIKLISY